LRGVKIVKGIKISAVDLSASRKLSIEAGRKLRGHWENASSFAFAFRSNNPLNIAPCYVSYPGFNPYKQHRAETVFLKLAIQGDSIML